MRGALVLLAGLLASASASSAAAQVAGAVDVSVLARAVARGEVLGIDDFGTEPRSAAQARGAIAAADAGGREATRNLSAGSVVRASDLIAPRLVRRGEPVQVTVRSGGLAIATPGRALGGGAAGDLVRVVVTATNRTLDGVVDGPGRVRISY